MAFLLDTNIFSELCKAASRQHPGVKNWLYQEPASEFYTSVLVIGELDQGVLRLQRRDPLQADRLATKLHQLRSFSGRALPVDLEVVNCWSKLNTPDPLPVIDGLLAATALVHDLTVATRNIRDFTHTGVSVFNPFSSEEH